MKEQGRYLTQEGLKLRKELFEQTLKETAWAKEDNGKYIPVLGDVEFRSFDSQSDAIKHAEKVRMTTLADHAWWIVGDGDEYRGVTARMCPNGN